MPGGKGTCGCVSHVGPTHARRQSSVWLQCSWPYEVRSRPIPNAPTTAGRRSDRLEAQVAWRTILEDISRVTQPPEAMPVSFHDPNRRGHLGTVDRVRRPNGRGAGVPGPRARRVDGAARGRPPRTDWAGWPICSRSFAGPPATDERKH